MPGTTRRDLEELLSGCLAMEMLNRSVVIMKPRRPYLEWTKTDDAEGLAESVIEDMRNEPQVYLLPE